MPNVPRLRAAIYSRISKDPEGRRLGVERQEEDCTALARAEDWALLDTIYRENDTSASTTSRKPRPVFEQLCADVEAGLVDVIVAYSTSRLTRRPSEYERLIRYVYDYHLKVETVVSGHVDLTTADGRAMARILAAIDAAETERAAERILRSLKQRTEQGFWSGRPPYGYVKKPGPQNQGRLAIHPPAADLLRELANRLLRGESTSEVRNDWLARGMIPDSDNTWSTQRLNKALRSPAIAGLTQFEGKYFAATWPAILSVARWHRVCDLLADPHRATRGRNHAGTYALAGLLFCNLCGRMLTMHTSAKVETYLCAQSIGGCGKIRIQARPVERYLFDLLEKRQAGAPMLTLNREQVARINELAAIREQLHRVQDDHYEHRLERVDYERQVRRIQKELASARRAITNAGVERYAMPPGGGLPALPAESRRAQLLRVIDRIDVDPHAHRSNQDLSHDDTVVAMRMVARRIIVRWMTGEPSPSPFAVPDFVPDGLWHVLSTRASGQPAAIDTTGPLSPCQD